MRIGNIEKIPLNTDEIIWKKAYNSGNKSLWDKAITPKKQKKEISYTANR